MSTRASFFVSAFAVVVASCLCRQADACTSILVTKGASADGSTMISYSCDGEFFPTPRITLAADRMPGDVKEIRSWREVKGKIPEAAHTYKVVGLVNEHQVAFGETTFGGRNALINEKGMFHYYPLMLIALERAKTARQAIDVMTALVEKFGYASEGESISIADKNEVWLFEIVGLGKGRKGAAWVAVRVPDGMIGATANMARIREFSFDDPDNVKYSKNVKSFAIEKGYYNPKSKEPFRFSDAYNPPTQEQVRYSARRVWSIFRRVAPSSNFSPAYSSFDGTASPYPLFIKPDKKLSVRDVIALHRDHYEGTEFDMTRDLSAGPFGAPDRWRPMKWELGGRKYTWERPIATQQAAFVYVSQSRAHIPDDIGAIAWYGLDNPYTNFFVPFYSAITELPKSYVTGSLERFTRDSAWWAFNFVANYANLRYSHMIKDIQKTQKAIEDELFELQIPVEKTAMGLAKNNPKAAERYLTNYCVTSAEDNIRKWWNLADQLVTKYNDGYVQEKTGEPDEVGYPEEWLKKEIEHGPGKKPLTQEKEQDRDL